MGLVKNGSNRPQKLMPLVYRLKPLVSSVARRIADCRPHDPSLPYYTMSHRFVVLVDRTEVLNLDNSATCGTIADGDGRRAVIHRPSHVLESRRGKKRDMSLSYLNPRTGAEVHLGRTGAGYYVEARHPDFPLPFRKT